MPVMSLLWQRLVDEHGQTCERCGTTEAAVEAAVHQLNRSLNPLGITVVLEKREISRAQFIADPLQSNRIWIAGVPLETWLAATPGKSKCCSTCGDADCRTVTVDGKTYEAIPAELIVRAGLLAAAGLLQGASSDSCCGQPGEGSGKNASCCSPFPGNCC